MAAKELRTFKDIQDLVREEVKIQSTDTETINRIKRDINAVYLNEVSAYERWKWLRQTKDVTLVERFDTGTVSVTKGSTTVTLSSAPTTSKRGHFFALKQKGEIYRIAQHTASSTTVILEAPYTETTNAAANYQIWTDAIALPTDCRETFHLTDTLRQTPMENLGLQEFRNQVLLDPFAEFRPRFYTVSDYVDPAPYQTISGLPALSTRASNGLVRTLVFAADVSSLLEAGDGIEVSASANQAYNGRFIVSSVSTTTITYTAETIFSEAAVADGALTVKSLSNESASERYRELLVHPSVQEDKITIHVDYIRKPPALEADADEPLMPIEDRIIIAYGALIRAWSRERNPEEASRNAQLYANKMAHMRGKLDDSTDKATLMISKSYLSVKRDLSRFPFDFTRFD